MQCALFRTVLGAMRTVLHCFACGIIKLQKAAGRWTTHPPPRGFCIARPQQGNTHSFTQQPECTSRAILILLCCGTVRVCTPAGSWNRYGSLKHHPNVRGSVSPSGHIPFCPVSCRCGQLRTDSYYKKRSVPLEHSFWEISVTLWDPGNISRPAS